MSQGLHSRVEVLLSRSLLLDPSLGLQISNLPVDLTLLISGRTLECAGGILECCCGSVGKGGGPSLPVSLNSGGSSDIRFSIQELCVGIGAGSFKICATTGTGASTDLIVVSDSWSLSNATFECILKGSIIGIRVIIVTGGIVSTLLVVGCVAFCSHLDSWDSAVFVWLY